MLKTLLLLIVLAVAGYFAYLHFLKPAPETRACLRLGELCGKKDDANACERTFADLKKTAGDEALENTAACLAKAESCPAGLRCMAGLVGKAGADSSSGA